MRLRDGAALTVGPLAPFLRGEGWGEGRPHGKCSWRDLYPLTRIASDDAIRPLPAGGARWTTPAAPSCFTSLSDLRTAVESAAPTPAPATPAAAPCRSRSSAGCR